MISIQKVSKIINNELILNNINLNFRNKELVCILGPSGSGKTTLLNIIGKIDIPTKGKVLFNNLNLNKINEDELHNQIISFIFQDYNLLPNLSVKDNILLPTYLNGNKYISLKKVFSKLNLQGISFKNVLNLSGGEKQRVCIARSIIQNSQVILADEPTGALDTSNSLNIMNILKKEATKKLVIVVTHNEDLAKLYASRIIKIKDGKIISDSNPLIMTKKDKKAIPNLKKIKIPFKSIWKISINNLKYKKKRSLLTIIAFAIGLFSLAIILSINNGFSKELVNYEKEYLYNYPLIISKEGTSLTSNVKENIIKEDNKISINKNTSLVTNDLNNDLLTKIGNISSGLYDDLVYYKDINIYFKNVSYAINNMSFFKLVKGDYPQNDHEVMLLLDYNHAIDEQVQRYLKISDNSYSNYLNHKFKVDNEEFTITAIVESDNEYFASLNGILYQSKAFNADITDIYIYPKDYESKEIIKNELTGVNIIDNALSSIKIIKNIINVISYVLIVFSCISLIVSSFMIAIITYISVIERTKEIGILKSIGFKKGAIKSLFLFENLTMSIFSSLLGLTLCQLVAFILNNYIKNKMLLENIILLSPKIVLTTIIFSLVLTFVSSVIPACKASQKRIIAAIRNTE